MFKHDGKGGVQILNVGDHYLNNTRTFIKLGRKTLVCQKRHKLD